MSLWWGTAIHSREEQGREPFIIPSAPALQGPHPMLCPRRGWDPWPLPQQPQDVAMWGCAQSGERR